MPARAWAAVVILAAAPLLSNLKLLTGVAAFWEQRSGPDGVSSLESRFVALKAALPASGPIGYMTDPGVSLEETDAKAELHLTQYALAPWIIEPDAGHTTVVGNFRNAVDGGAISARGLDLVRDFGDGLYLFRRERR